MYEEELKHKAEALAQEVQDHSCFVLGTGFGSCGAIGVGKTQHSFFLEHVHLPSNTRIKEVSCGHDQSVFLTTDGFVYVCGAQGLCGGQGDGSITEPVLLSVNEDFDGNVVHVSADYYHSIAVTRSGKVYGWGRSDFKGAHLMPEVIFDGNPFIVDASAGHGFTIALDSSGKVWGSGRMFVDKVALDVPKQFCIDRVLAGWNIFLLVDNTHSSILLFKDSTSYGIKTFPHSLVDVSCGANEAVAVDSMGNCYAFQSASNETMTPFSQSPAFASKPYACTAGYAHKVFVCERGEAWATAGEDYGSRGVGGEYKRGEWVLVPGINEIYGLTGRRPTQVFHGYYQTFYVYRDLETLFFQDLANMFLNAQ